MVRVLRNYDAPSKRKPSVEDLAIGEKFIIRDGRMFERGEKLRKRIKCYELPLRRTFLFSPIYEVEKLL